MPGPLDWWNRIRRVVGPPGAPATRAAVPTAAGAAQRAELAEVFTHLDELEVELRRAEEQCVEETTAIVDAAKAERVRILADARERATTASTEAAAQHQRASDHESAQLRAEAASRADELQRAAAALIPTLVADAVARVRSFAITGGSGFQSGNEASR